MSKTKGKMSKKRYMGFGFMVFVFSMLASVIVGLIFALPIMVGQLVLIYEMPALAALILVAILIVAIPVFFMILGWVFYTIGNYRRK